MDLNQIILTILTVTIPSLITYLATTKSNQSKIKEIEAINKLETERLKYNQELKYKELESTIEKMKLEHSNEIEKMHLSYQLKKEEASSQMTANLTKDFLTGSLDLSTITSSIDQLSVVQQKVNKLNNKSNTSNFLNKK
ncbi:hypothetical protein [Anaerorhabdus furcosa]|uniref:Uncharacterized protein n=1 Tax=Anaerorhabdus furcosa TaxID=118967 RepID=A0A1T4LZ21_9FIRM|nr:hypothetical protein [Anaerorhabdus furcosa]SJZ59896.1 hypothetical protein SAMN02745191_1114 [Anaerorhabdus furcosa]